MLCAKRGRLNEKKLSDPTQVRFKEGILHPKYKEEINL